MPLGNHIQTSCAITYDAVFKGAATRAVVRNAFGVDSIQHGDMWNMLSLPGKGKGEVVK